VIVLIYGVGSLVCWVVRRGFSCHCGVISGDGRNEQEIV
jgi:hypothetical protein